jgi:transposase
VKRIAKQEYTAEFKEQAVRHARAVGIVVAAKEPGPAGQTPRN